MDRGRPGPPMLRSDETGGVLCFETEIQGQRSGGCQPDTALRISDERDLNLSAV